MSLYNTLSSEGGNTQKNGTINWACTCIIFDGTLVSTAVHTKLLKSNFLQGLFKKYTDIVF